MKQYSVEYIDELGRKCHDTWTGLLLIKETGRGDVKILRVWDLDTDKEIPWEM